MKTECPTGNKGLLTNHWWYLRMQQTFLHARAGQEIVLKLLPGATTGSFGSIGSIPFTGTAMNYDLSILSNRYENTIQIPVKS